MRAVAGHAGLAGLAELWSSFSCGFRYDPARTQLWVKPFLLGRWLTLLHDREYEVRVVGHGVRSGRYDQLAKDPAGFKPESWHEHGNGIYVSPFDAIPADCGRSSTGGGPSARAIVYMMVIALAPLPTTSFQGGCPVTICSSVPPAL